MISCFDFLHTHHDYLVCEIMLKWLELHDWQQAFMDTIPGRKLKDVKLVENEATQEDEKEDSQEVP